MAWFVLQRLLTLIATLLGASAVVFWVLEVLPGNAAQVLLGPDAAPEAVAALAAQLGLDQPALTRYGQWIAGLLTGSLGESHAYGAPVFDLIVERLQLTIPLALLAMAITCALALAAGLYAAARHGRLGDWGSHKVEHELSASFDIAHGAGLAIVFPAWMKHALKQYPAKLEVERSALHVRQRAGKG